MDPISDASKALKEEKEAQKNKLTKAERKEIATLVGQSNPVDISKKRVKRRIVKGPNPLSVKKKKLVVENGPTPTSLEPEKPAPKRKRKSRIIANDV